MAISDKPSGRWFCLTRFHPVNAITTQLPWEVRVFNPFYLWRFREELRRALILSRRYDMGIRFINATYPGAAKTDQQKQGVDANGTVVKLGVVAVRLFNERPGGARMSPCAVRCIVSVYHRGRIQNSYTVTNRKVQNPSDQAKDSTLALNLWKLTKDPLETKIGMPPCTMETNPVTIKYSIGFLDFEVGVMIPQLVGGISHRQPESSFSWGASTCIFVAWIGFTYLTYFQTRKWCPSSHFESPRSEKEGITNSDLTKTIVGNTSRQTKAQKPYANARPTIRHFKTPGEPNDAESPKTKIVVRREVGSVSEKGRGPRGWKTIL